MTLPRKELAFEALLEYLKRNRGFDFTGYKRTSLTRRIEKRMMNVGVDSFAEYVDYLEVHPDEFPYLFSTILINVTAFFRDTASWEVLAREILPELIRQKETGQIRVWSAGCASGEEAYTIVMLFAEHLGIESFKERVTVYATDMDNEALDRGRHATYTEEEVADVPPALLKKYFDVVEGRHIFRKDLRRHVIFGRHDLITDAPISGVDLLVCRNTLMYLNSETQGKILARFHFALNDNGILFLGGAETLLTQAQTFQPVDAKRRISRKAPRKNLDLRDRLETTNEELQSTNDELETINEELQSTNEELHTINDELRVRSEQLNEIDTFLESMLTAVRACAPRMDRSAGSSS